MEMGFIINTVFVIISALIVLRVTSWVLSLRRVVSTNEVHIVQTRKRTVSYGKDTDDKLGNIYYEWPHWLPVIGITKIVLPVSVFAVQLNSYEAYDKGRLPFVVDVMAFFRISNSNMAASRVSSFQELQDQLHGIVQGAVRSIMANAELEAIMSERSLYGQKFTEEVLTQLTQWGVTPVKNIELMDIRDSHDNHVIQNIMAKKKSHIEMESRIEVAKNIQAAQEAEIVAKQQIDLKAQEAEQTVGLRRATVAQEVGIANEMAQQQVKEQARVTKEKEMAVVRVETIQNSQIAKESNVIKAEEVKQVTVLDAEGKKQMTVLDAEGKLEAQKKLAEGIRVEGEAKADAEKAMQLAPVEAQIVLAKEIGENPAYQTYLVTLKEIDAKQAVGLAQANNLRGADIKIIANAGDIPTGATSAMELFTAKGGLNVGAALEALANTDQGKAILDKITK